MSHKVKRNHVLAALLLFSAVLAELSAGEQVEIIRDNFGVPHIFAETDEAVFFGSGYAQAEDRLEELLRNYRRSVGTESEVFGESHYQDDYRQRMWRHAEISEANFKTIRPKMQRLLRAYIDGVKAFMEEHPDQVPDWAPEIHPWHVLALSRYIIWGWPEGDAGGDLRRGGIRPDPIAYRGSNQWVIAPDRTEIGAPIALIDPHLGWYGPFRFYELRLYGDELKVSGASILGVPLPALGHSQWCSVAMTTGSGDTADVFVETINPDDPLQYRVDGEWRDMEVRRERIGVRRSDGTVDQVEEEFHYTRHGPVVARKDGKAYVMALPYMESVGLTDQLWDMMTAKNLTEMKAALGQLELMGQNIMVATVDGDIYYQRTGKVPIRAEGVDPSRPIPGDSTDNDWKGIYKAGELVQVENPPQGYMQNCNVSPFAMMKESPMRLGDYPRHVYGAAESPPHQRAAMAVEILDRTAKMSVQGALELAMNTEVFGAESWQRMLKEVWAESKSDLDVSRDAARLYEHIVSWDRHSEPQSLGALAYYYWKGAIPGEARRADRLGGPPSAQLSNEQWVESIVKASEEMVENHGSVDVPYGEVFRVGRQGADKTYAVGGGNPGNGMATLRAIGFTKNAEGVFVGRSGQTSTQLVVLTKPPQSWMVLPLGQSDHEDSGHWDDQAEKLFSAGKLKPTYFMDPEGLKAVTESRRTLDYEPGS